MLENQLWAQQIHNYFRDQKAELSGAKDYYAGRSTVRWALSTVVP